jgi:hypothetical protein
MEPQAFLKVLLAISSSIGSGFRLRTDTIPANVQVYTTRLV